MLNCFNLVLCFSVISGNPEASEIRQIRRKRTRTFVIGILPVRKNLKKGVHRLLGIWPIFKLTIRKMTEDEDVHSEWILQQAVHQIRTHLKRKGPEYKRGWWRHVLQSICSEGTCFTIPIKAAPLVSLEACSTYVRRGVAMSNNSWAGTCWTRHWSSKFFKLVLPWQYDEQTQAVFRMSCKMGRCGDFWREREVSKSLPFTSFVLNTTWVSSLLRPWKVLPIANSFAISVDLILVEAQNCYLFSVTWAASSDSSTSPPRLRRKAPWRLKYLS